ncbi:chemotaxis protein CheW [Agarilytica rhodophyticola]|uniref:chemotaxis protein CheW n=1 Tax=Agarilytica rhodophyticola TaxID=1737490 RepID=UPI000B34735B|nr:chemotaxis protein CheW [Agarilytica rhodophyticola]
MNTQWVNFEIADEDYCLTVDDIQEILNYETPTPVPGAVDEVTGILNVRGEIVTVLSGRRLLDLEHKDPQETWRIITMQSHGIYYGLVVDAVNEMIDINLDKLDTAPNTGSASTSELILGTYHHKERLIIALDLTKYVESA